MEKLLNFTVFVKFDGGNRHEKKMFHWEVLAKSTAIHAHALISRPGKKMGRKQVFDTQKIVGRGKCITYFSAIFSDFTNQDWIGKVATRLKNEKEVLWAGSLPLTPWVLEF